MKREKEKKETLTIKLGLNRPAGIFPLVDVLFRHVLIRGFTVKCQRHPLTLLSFEVFSPLPYKGRLETTSESAILITRKDMKSAWSNYAQHNMP